MINDNEYTPLTEDEALAILIVYCINNHIYHKHCGKQRQGTVSISEALELLNEHRDVLIQEGILR